MIEVELPDGNIAEFPDGTSNADMEKALKGYAKPQGPSPEAVAAQQAKDRETYKPTEGFFSNFAAGYGRSSDKVMDALTDAYLAFRGEDSARKGLQANVTEKRELDKPLMNTWGGNAGAISNDVAMTALPASRAMRVASMAPQGLRAAAQVAAAAGLGAGYEGMQVPTEGQTRAGNAATGAVFGAGGQVAGSVLGRSISGLVQRSRAARRLPQEVQDAATLGQVADKETLGGRIVSGVEERLRSVPVLGDYVTNARARGTEAWRGSVVDDVLPPGMQRPQSGTMRETMDEIQNEFTQQYGRALQGTQVRPSNQFEQFIAQVEQDPNIALTPDQKAQIANMVREAYGGHFQQMPGPYGVNGPTVTAMTGEQAKRFESWLSARARNARQATTPDSQAQAEMFGTLESAWEQAYRTQLPQNTRQALQAIDAQYAPFKTVERAATAVGNDSGAFTPSQLVNAVKARSTQPEFASGNAMLQDAADAGKAVFQDRIADSGTAGRLMNYGALGAMVMDPLGAGATLAGTGLASVPVLTSRLGKNAMTGDTRAQLLLQRLRAHEAARTLGLPTGIGLENLTE